ncbi:MAG: hypothetical protein Q9171_001796 [Xanthocarpia ochracea]
MQNQQAGGREAGEADGFDPERFMEGLHALLDDDAVDFALLWPADQLGQKQKINLQRLAKHFLGQVEEEEAFVDASEEVRGPVEEVRRPVEEVGGPLEEADNDVQMIELEDYDASLTSIKTPTPQSGGIKRELRDNITDSPTTNTPNAFNKAILARNELELDSLFQELVEGDIDKDKLRDILKKDMPRYTDKLSQACRLLRLLFVDYLCRQQSPRKPIAQSDTQGLTVLSTTLQQTSAEGKMVVGQEILGMMNDPAQRKTLVDMAQRLGRFCQQFSTGSIFYLVDVLDQDKNLLAIKTKTTEKTIQPSFTRLQDLNIKKEAQRSRMEKLGEVILSLIKDACLVEESKTDVDGGRNS